MRPLDQGARPEAAVVAQEAKVLGRRRASPEHGQVQCAHLEAIGIDEQTLQRPVLKR